MQPGLRRLELVYVPRNSRPEVSELRAHPAGVVYRQNASFEDGLPFAQVPAVVAAELREQEAGQGNGAAATAGGSTFRGRPLFIPGRRTITWQASDPDGDGLWQELMFRHEGGQRWSPLAEGFEGNTYVFDTTRVPDGRYEMQLTVSDRADNAVDAVLEASVTSQAFVVDNTPPIIAGLSASPEGDELRIVGRASDTTSIVLRIRYSVNGGEWRTVLPADGVADSGVEPFSFAVSVEGAGEHTIVVQVTDGALNRGAGQVVLQR
jgi:hypothetical protein